jgi:hypothetical protein
MTDDDNAIAPAPFAEEAGVLVSPRGLPRMPRPGRRSDPDRPVTDLPSFGRVGYLAVSDAELALFKTTKIGMHPGPKGDPLTRVPLAAVVAAELEERRVVAFLQLHYSDEATWTLQIGLINRPATAGRCRAALDGEVRAQPRHDLAGCRAARFFIHLRINLMSGKMIMGGSLRQLGGWRLASHHGDGRPPRHRRQG